MHLETWWWNRDFEPKGMSEKLAESKSVEDKHTLDVAKKEVYAAVLAAQELKLQECTADLQRIWQEELIQDC